MRAPLGMIRGEREARAALFIEGHDSPLCLAALSGQPPKARRGAPSGARVDGESARRAIIVVPTMGALGRTGRASATDSVGWSAIKRARRAGFSCGVDAVMAWAT